MSDLIDRQAAIDALNEQIEQCNKALGSFDISLKDEFAIKVERASLKAYKEQLENLPPVQPERLTDDDFETIRIHLNAYKEKLCNQQRWKEAEEYQRIIDRFMAFASAQPNHNAEVSKMGIIHCKDCKHWNLQVGNVKGDGLGSCDFHNVNFVTGEGFCYWADRRGEADG